MPVVTVSGQTGSNAREVARLAAQRLGIDYIDQQLLVQAAASLGVPVEAIVPFDERTASLGERLAGILRRFLERSAAGAIDPTLGASGLEFVLGRTYGQAVEGEPPEVSDDRYRSTLCAIVRDLGSHGDVLIVGRGGQVILKDAPDALHLLLVGPLERRIETLARQEGIDAEAAARRVHDRDRERAAFHQKFFKVDPNQPSLYHLVLNTAWFSPGDAAQLIAEASQRVQRR